MHALRVCACCQGIDFDEKGLVLISDNIRKALGIDVSVLMGANVAKEVRRGGDGGGGFGTGLRLIR